MSRTTNWNGASLREGTARARPNAPVRSDGVRPQQAIAQAGERTSFGGHVQPRSGGRVPHFFRYSRRLWHLCRRTPLDTPELRARQAAHHLEILFF